jgi:hypothetical protein
MSTSLFNWGKKIQAWGKTYLPLLILTALSLTITVLLFQRQLSSLPLSDVDNVVPDWHSILGRTEDRLEKTLLLPDLSQHSKWYLAIYVSRSNVRQNPIDLIIEADGIPVYRIDDSDFSWAQGWLKVPIDQKLLNVYEGKTKANIALRVEGQPDLSLNYVYVYGTDIPERMSEGSRFNGHSDDLSLEPGQQQGDFLIRLIPVRQVPPLPGILAFLILPVFAYTLLILYLDKRWATIGAGGVLLTATLLVWFRYDQIIFRMPMFIYVLYALLLASWMRAVNLGKPVKQQLVVSLTLVVIVLWGFSQYWTVLSTVADKILDPDAIMYRFYASLMDLFSETGFYSASFGQREPMWPFLVHLAFNLLEPSDFTLRLVSLFFTLTVIIATYWLGMALLESHWAGLFAALLVSVDPLWAEQSVRGLREPIYATLWLLFCLACFGLRDGPSFHGFKRAILTGIVGGVVLLTRPNAPVLLGLILIMPLLSWSGRRFLKRNSHQVMPCWTLSMALVTLLLAITMYIPHLYGMYERYGDPFWSTRHYARYLANMEFQDRIGTPGFPSLEEFVVSGFAGPPLSYGEYLFGLHSPSELVRGIFQGYTQILVNITDGVPIAIIYLIAFPLVIMDQRRWPLLFTMLISIAPVAFLYSKGLVERYRNIIDLEPLVVIGAVYVLVCLRDVLIRSDMGSNSSIR